MNTRANPNRSKVRAMRRGDRIHHEKRASLLTAERCLRRACDQILLLNQRREQLVLRYDAALVNSNCHFRYILRLKLAVVEGVRNAYYVYAQEKANMADILRRELGQSIA